MFVEVKNALFLLLDAIEVAFKSVPLYFLVMAAKN